MTHKRKKIVSFISLENYLLNIIQVKFYFKSALFKFPSMKPCIRQHRGGKVHK